MSQNKETDKRSVTFELAALFTFSLVLIGHLSVTKYAEGYYSHFGVTLPEINFTPQVYDYVNIVLFSLIGTSVVVAVVVFFMKIGIWVGAAMAEKTKPSKKFLKFAEKRKQKFITFANVLEWSLRIVFWGFIIIASFYSIYTLSDILGKGVAQGKTNYSSISPEGDDLQKVIIYKNDNEITLKIYSMPKKEFLEGYEVINGATYTTRNIRI